MRELQEGNMVSEELLDNMNQMQCSSWSVLVN